MAALCTPTTTSRRRNGRSASTTASCPRRLGSRRGATTCGARRVPRNAATAPTAISPATASPMARYPGAPPPAARTTSGATAPDTSTATAMPATRQLIRRVHSAGSVVSSAGIAA